MHNVVIRPLLTEKMTDLTEKNNQYGFIVNINTNKIEIKRAIEKKFEVKVASINTIRHKGKSKTQFTKKGRFTGRTPKYKKAIVTLKEDQVIDLFGEV